MGLCPDCRSEGETITYIGASRADLIDSVGDDSTDEEPPDAVDGSEENGPHCDLCGEPYNEDDRNE